MEEQKSIRDEAQAYEAPARTQNIADLPQVSTDISVVTETHKNKDGEEFTLKVITVNGAKYRVPVSVLSQLKIILEDNPSLKKFKVKKSGVGMDTEYIVIPSQ